MRGETQRSLILILGLLNLAVLGGIALLLLPPTEKEPEDQVRRRFVAAGADEDPICRDCNLLMISLDIFRPDHLPCFGYDRRTAPNICDMARRGTLFDSFIVHSYMTPISQMSIFTGRYPSNNGFISFASQLPPEVPYFPEALSAAGYQTVAMGSSFEVMADMSSFHSRRARFRRDGLNPGLSFGRGFDRFVFTGNRNVPSDAITWLREQAEEPFFLWLILGTLHWPYGATGDPMQKDKFVAPGYEGDLDRFPNLGFKVLSRIYKNRLHSLRDGESTSLDATDLEFIRARYDFGLWTVDRFIGDLMESIPDDLLRNTVIVLHGIHGEDLGEHGYFGHYDIYDTEVRSAVVVLNPKHRVEARRVREQVEGIDLAPTLLEILDLDPLPGIDGESFVEALKTGRGDPDRAAFFERIPLWENIFRHRSQVPLEFTSGINELLDQDVVGDTGMRTGRWKLLHRKARHIEKEVSWWTYLSGEPLQRPEWELYDLANDPREQRNVIADHPHVSEELRRRLTAWEESLDSGHYDQPRPSVEEAP
ncbi:MAG: hypothetical protein CME06_13360 [Gemmatimonadetes bacterium]|nr:hypothetical protein [Gemmatimonadota bacterium]